jgi:hypothetical protein|tara:strand:+ start:3263 stop:3397 length:135 start_codon:yes stop_codon:yes gene_type:complete
LIEATLGFIDLNPAARGELGYLTLGNDKVIFKETNYAASNLIND